MTTKSKAGPTIASLKHEIADLDDRIIGEVVGVMQAISELRKALDEVEACLDRRQLEKAADLGYGSVSSGFVFVQRTLGGLNGVCSEKAIIVQEVAAKLACSYEEALPHVEAVMQSAHPRRQRKR